MSSLTRKIAQNSANLALFAWTVVLLAACADEPPAPAANDAVLVEVGQTAIRVADYRQFIARVAPELRAEYGAEKLLEAIVEQTLLVQEAERRGLGESAEFVQWQAQAQAQIQAWWEEATKGGTQAPALDNPPPGIDNDGDAAASGS